MYVAKRDKESRNEVGGEQKLDCMKHQQAINNVEKTRMFQIIINSIDNL
jgi:hypothetical protein